LQSEGASAVEGFSRDPVIEGTLIARQRTHLIGRGRGFAKGMPAAVPSGTEPVSATPGLGRLVAP